MCSDEVVECARWRVDRGLELVPGGFDDFKEDVVLELVDEVGHFADGAPRGFPVGAELVAYR